MSVQTLTRSSPAEETRTGLLRRNLVVAIQIGLIGGLVALLMCLEGMVEVLAIRDIVGGIIAAGPALILITFMLSGHLAVARAQVSARSAAMIWVALVAGLVDSALVAGLLLAFNALPQMRNIFVNTTPAMIKLLTFGQPLEVGIPLLLALGAFLGALPAALRFLPPAVARGLIVAAAALFLLALLQELLRVTAQNWEPLTALSKLVFAENGFTTGGATGLFVLVFAVSLIGSMRGKQISGGYRRLPALQQRALIFGTVAVLLAFLLVLPGSSACSLARSWSTPGFSF